MKFQILTENTVYMPGAKAEHGFSLYVQADDGFKVLFDTGQTGLFADNAALMGVDISAVDALVLSHGHYDHTGGVGRFLELNRKAKIYLKRGYDEDKRNRAGRYIGFPSDVALPHERVCVVDEVTELTKGVFVVPDIEIYDENDAHFRNLYVRRSGELCEDDFVDELFLAVMHAGKMNIVSGCAHRGIVNIVKSAVRLFDVPISMVLGGFHTSHEDEDAIKRLSAALSAFHIEKLVPCHCTGVEQYAQLNSHYAGKMKFGSVGFVIAEE